MELHNPSDSKFLQENFEDFFETNLCGFLIADPKGTILRANQKVANWINSSTDVLKGKRFSDLLTIGGKIYYETHLRPLLRIQGFFEEIVLELSDLNGGKLRVMVNGFERRNAEGQPIFTRFTIVKAIDRLQYEQNLQLSKSVAEQELAKQTETVALREQLIAVLGHDLRNPLSSIAMAVQLLEFTPGTNNANLLAILQRSCSRMFELVNNIMDFARTRLGDGIVLNNQDIILTPVLEQVVAEIRLVYPQRVVTTLFDIIEPVHCDPDRIAQLLSNLLSNALSHGDIASSVEVRAVHNNKKLELSVSNKGIPIPENLHDQLFKPFTREGNRPSKQGLGLGLYICSEIARAHHATLSFTTTKDETSFTFLLNK